MRGLRQGNRTVLAQARGTFELPSTNNFQMRFDKDFLFGNQRRFRVSLDLINVFNVSTPVSVRNNSSQGEALFGQSLEVFAPRRAMLGFRIEVLTAAHCHGGHLPPWQSFSSLPPPSKPMHMSNRRAVVMTALLLMFAWTLVPVTGQSGARIGEWRTYGGDLASTRYAPLDQINADNFNQLEVAWRFKTDNLGPAGPSSTFRRPR